MGYPVLQSSYTSGELAPTLRGRVDLAKFRVGLMTQLNWYSLVHGGSTTRPGTGIVGEIYDSAAAGRLLSFQFSTTQNYMLVFENLRMRVIRNGGFVLEATTAITGITQANPAVVTAAAHGYATGDDVFIAAVGGMTTLNQKRFRIAVLTANTYQLVGVDSSAYPAYTAGGTAARVYTLPTPYVTADLPLLKFVQSFDTLTVTHPSYAPRNITRTGHAAWTISVIVFAPVTAAPTGLASSSAGATYSYVVTATDDTTGEESLPSAVVTSNTRTSTITWTPVANCSQYSIYFLRDGIYGFVGTSGTAGFTDTTVLSNVGDTPPVANNPFVGADNYPGCATYWVQRKIYARTNNKLQSVFTSVTAALNNMSSSTPLKDDDAIVKTLAVRQVNEIRAMIPLDDLLLFTSGGVFVASGADPVTPANLLFKKQVGFGASNVPPIEINADILYVQEKGGAIYDLAYQFAANKYVTTEVSILSTHLFEGRTIVDWCFAQVPHKLVWVVLDNGALLSFTFHKEQDVYGWARHATDGLVESVATTPEGGEDAVYFIVKRTINGVTKRYVERLQSRLYASLTEAWCVDCGVRYSGAPASIISGLDHIEAKTAVGLADGVAFSKVVTGGRITLDAPASVVIVGLPYTCDMQTLGVEVGPPTAQGKFKRVAGVMLRLDKTKGIKVGAADFLDLQELQPDIYGVVGVTAKTETAAAELFTGAVSPVIGAIWEEAGSICIRQDLPMPATILGDVLSLEIGSA